ncbi:Fic family protein [Mesorhizobium sp. M0488]|uniref:Fic family protein n=1 Tax=unclassified Mesorhizobium TaxID=325217 RepID=UPI00333B77A3
MTSATGWSIRPMLLTIALRFHVRLTWIRPFPNGNGRHARLAATYWSCPLAASDSPGVAEALSTQRLPSGSIVKARASHSSARSRYPRKCQRDGSLLRWPFAQGFTQNQAESRLRWMPILSPACK